jgi:hypothetical protein
MEIRDDQVFAATKDVLHQEVSGEVVLLDLASEQYFGLDEVGARIWKLLGEGLPVADIVDTLLGEYEVERARLEADVRALLTELLDAGLIES